MNFHETILLNASEILKEKSLTLQFESNISRSFMFNELLDRVINLEASSKLNYCSSCQLSIEEDKNSTNSNPFMKLNDSNYFDLNKKINKLRKDFKIDDLNKKIIKLTEEIKAEKDSVRFYLKKKKEEYQGLIDLSIQKLKNDFELSNDEKFNFIFKKLTKLSFKCQNNNKKCSFKNNSFNEFFDKVIEINNYIDNNIKPIIESVIFHPFNGMIAIPKNMRKRIK